MTMLNLDQLAAQYAQKIVAAGGAEIENLITKTLGVLQEQGVYACLLFLSSRTSSNEKSLAEKSRPHLYGLLQELPAFREAEISDANALAFFSDNICGDLDTLLLVRELYEQTLIYARYGAKAAGK
ncbi:MAG: hypothetical protein KJZ86_16260 [Caldilineaceae bacterium]|nr:hypothetical protein [Caldilineaceae bacterium]HRJ42151.1 hypothetical protein [Caldilineaceae bacterium]